MARRKLGAGIGYTDVNGEQIRVGDYLTSGGKVYRINSYGAAQNDEIGTVRFGNLIKPTLISEEEAKKIQNMGTLPEEVLADEDEDEVKFNDDEIPEAPVPQWTEADDDLKREAEELTELPKKLEMDFELSTFSEDDLLDELRRRGYFGNIKKKVYYFIDVMV